jgi:hypothetical protein
MPAPLQYSGNIRPGLIQMRRLVPRFEQSTIQDQGHPRFRRLEQLVVEAQGLLVELKDVRSYEQPAAGQAPVWYKKLWEESKKAERWVSENRPKNAHSPVIVPDDVYLPLAEMCIGYRRELNDSYHKYSRYILEEEAALKEKYKSTAEAEGDSDSDDENPLSVPKWLYRWVSTEEAKRAKKDGIQFDSVGGGIPTSTKSGKGIAVTSGAVFLDKLITIDVSKIPNFKFEYVPTRSKLKEVKIKCDVPAEAIS